MLVGPPRLTFCKLSAVDRRRGRICNLGNKIRRRRFRNAVYKYTKEWNLKEEVEADTKPKEQTLTIVKPSAFLILVEPYSRKIGLELSISALLL